MDYSKIQLKSGLELHRQLKTHKLFCECPSILRKDKPDFIITRKLRSVAGEIGKIDLAAAFEASKSLKYKYEGYNDTTCNVELDEEPPHSVNLEALDIALLIAKMLNCKIPDVIQFMRKTVVDGSNTSGFQRTALIGTDGWINTKHGKVRIENVSLEEDAARRTSEKKGSVNYRLDRLGIPEIEIGTAPDMKTPEQVQEVADRLGSLLKSTGKVARGIGKVRQDINISTYNHPRVELKMVQDLKAIPDIVRKEAHRQQQQVKAGKKELPHVRNVKSDNTSKYLRPMPGAARMYPETDHPLIKITKQMINSINLPETPDSKIKRYKNIGLSEDLAKQLLDSGSELFEMLYKKFKKIDSTLIASTILSTAKDIQRKLNQTNSSFSKDHFIELFNLINKGKITKEAIPSILEEVAQGKELIKSAKKFKILSKVKLKKEINNLKEKHKNSPEHKLKGIIIGKLKGKANIEDIINLLD